MAKYLLNVLADRLRAEAELSPMSAALFRLAADEIERIQGELHDCPVCGMSCKQCQCVEEQIYQLQTVIKGYKADIEGMSIRTSELQARIAELEGDKQELIAEIDDPTPYGVD
jgi:DNA repair ATPase RecN